MNVLQRIGRFFAGRAGGTKAVAAFDAAPASKKDDVVLASVKDLAQQKLVDRYKPVVIGLIDQYAVDFAATETGLAGQTRDAIEREIIRRIEVCTHVPAAVALPLQIEVSRLFDRIDVTAYIAQGRAGVYLLADKVKAAVNGMRL